MLGTVVGAVKMGWGDSKGREMLKKIASENKPVVLGAGGADIGEVRRAMAILRSVNSQIGLMQCNTNYTGSLENFKHIHLNVLNTYRVMFPDVILGLSDHTPQHATVLGAVALGARLVEKHFTDDNSREGPDHPFSMTPASWREMLDRTRELEYALGEADKRIADNESSTVVVQRRCLRAARNLEAGTVLSRDMIDVLRPAPPEAVPPYDIEKVLGKKLRNALSSGDAIRWTMLAD